MLIMIPTAAVNVPEKKFFFSCVGLNNDNIRMLGLKKFFYFFKNIMSQLTSRLGFMEYRGDLWKK